jgi:hypothetical protein
VVSRNTHTHTLESDGDSAPEEVVRWYREHGYDFLVITDHDKITSVDGGGLLLIPGEEVTDRLEKKPFHVNAIGLGKAVIPQHGTSVVQTLQHDVDAVVRATREDSGGYARQPGRLRAGGSERLRAGARHRLQWPDGVAPTAFHLDICAECSATPAGVGPGSVIISGGRSLRSHHRLPSEPPPVAA